MVREAQIREEAKNKHIRLGRAKGQRGYYRAALGLAPLETLVRSVSVVRSRRHCEKTGCVDARREYRLGSGVGSASQQF
jgi:hypothetical protein